MSERLRRASILVLAAMLFAGSAYGCAGVQPRAGFAQRLSEMYGEIEMEYRPDVRWWLAEGMNTDKTLEKNVQEIRDSGFGAAEILALPEDGADPAVYGWGSEEWNSDSRLIIEKAAEMGLGFSLTSGAHWSNANLPDTFNWNGSPYNADNVAASKELDYATVLVGAGESFDGEIPYPPQAMIGGNGGVPANYSEHVFEGVVAARLVAPREGSGQEFGYAEGTGVGTLDLSSITDLSRRVSKKQGAYSLKWTAPADGQYAIFAFWMHGTGQTAIPSVSTNYTINYMDAYGTEAMIDYWNENVLTDDLRKTLEDSGRGEIYMDSLEVSTYGAGGLFWGYDFKEEFQRRMGYDVTPYLPFIAAATGSTVGLSAKTYDYQPEGVEELETVTKVRNDYYQVMTEMYCENVLGPLREWLHSMNMTLRAEPSYGFNFEISEPARYLDDVETESYAQNADVDLYRGMLGSANMYGLPLSSETGAVRNHNFYFTMDQWTQLVYLQLANGVSRTVFHGYSAIEGSDGGTSWPGHEGMYPHFSERFGERQPAYEMYPEWTQMIARNQKAMRQGAPSRDIAVLRTDYNFINYGFIPEMSDFTNNYQMNDMTCFWSDLELQQNGYTYDYFSPSLLLDGDNVSFTADALQPDGPAYQAILIYQEGISLDAARKILEIAWTGLPIVFANNNCENLLNNGVVARNGEAASRSLHLGDSDEDVRAVIRQVKVLPNVRTVDAPSDAMEALQELGVYPRVAFKEPSSKVLTMSRSDAENDAYYTFAYYYKFDKDKGEGPATLTLSFEAEGKPYEIDDWSGEVSEIAEYEVADGRTSVTLSLSPGEAALIAIDTSDSGEGVHVASSTADATVLEDGRVSMLATESGEYETVLSTGEAVAARVEVPEAISLPAWDIVVEDWNEGDKVVNTEEKFGHVTSEAYYETKKTELRFPQSALAAWKDLPAAEGQLARLAGESPSMADVSGIATYTAEFDLPGGWGESNGALLKIGSTSGGEAQVFVNGRKAPGLDLRTLTVDISELLVDGTNKVEVRVASTLLNRMIQRGYPALATTEAASYGMTGEVWVVPYTVVEVK